MHLDEAGKFFFIITQWPVSVWLFKGYYGIATI